jgi:acyl-CoA reductase-like NAD-dependent aldehyde dehydrogenase
MRTVKLLINGQLVNGHKNIDVINPATGKAFMQIPVASEAQALEAVVAAKAAFPGWAATKIEDRQAMLRKLADRLQENAEEFAKVLVLEQGKPLAEATAEVLYAETFLRYFAAFNSSMETIQDDDEMQVEVYRKPLGVVVGIAPWNLPLLIGANKLGPALVTGNTIILKPAPTTSVTSLMLGELAKNIFPAGVINIIADENDLGPILSSHPDVAKVSFTGSTVTGRKVAQTAASSLKRLTLELGGNDAGIVLDDVDVSKIAERIFAGAFMNCGQVCIALKRLYVHENQYDEMCDALANIANNTKVGDGLDNGVKIGPLQNFIQFEKAQKYLGIAARDGKVIAGGAVLDRQGYFIQPTIVRDIDDSSPLVSEEQFAPILPIIKYRDVNDVIKRANNSEYGLGGSVWSSDVIRAKEVASQISTGTVWINHHLHFGPHIPFAGAKQSGLGVEFSKEGISEFTQCSVISVAK